MLTLSSDFGSPYPAAMKGVVLQRTDARLVDVAHDLPRQDVTASAFWLEQILPYFPPAVHLAVIDPGVGTDRDAIVVRAGEHALVGPDNGVLVPVARSLAGDDGFAVFRLDLPGSADPDSPADPGTDWPPNPASATFHGRDVFAPAAARVHEAGVDSIDDVPALERTDEFVDLHLPEPTVRDDGAVGTVLAVDGFGNAVTNVPGEVIADRMGSHVQANGVWAAARRTYAAVDEGNRVVTVGSHGNVELAVNQGRGDDVFGVSTGSRVRLSW